MVKYDAGRDPYIDPATSVLHNKLGLSNEAELSLIEALYSTKASEEWQRAPGVSSYNLTHLRAIHKHGFYPEITDGCERVENFKSSLAILRRILGLWRRSMYSNTSVLAASSVG